MTNGGGCGFHNEPRHPYWLLRAGAVSSAYRIEVESADDWNNLDHSDLPTSRFKEVFEIIREYVQYYGIPLEGTRDWRDRYG